MSKPLYLTIAACLGLVGCQVFEKSDAWQLATDVRPGDLVRDADPSGAYAAKLHGALAGEGIEHKVVTYQYQYYNRFHELVLGSRTAVVYRDNSSEGQPWWLKDDRLNTPFWLPNGPLDEQLTFYVRRKATVIEVKEYPGHGNGKAQVALRNAGPAPKTASQTRPLFKPANSSPRTEPLVAQGTPASQKFLFFKASAPKVAQPSEPVSSAPGITPASEQDAIAFRRLHGTEFNAESSLDRKKMWLIQQASHTQGAHAGLSALNSQ